MKAPKVGDIITFRMSPNWQSQVAAAAMTTTSSTIYTQRASVLTAIVLAVPIEVDGVIVMIWDGQRMSECVVNNTEIIKIISPYNEFIEEL